MIFQAHLAVSLWVCVLADVHIINRTPSGLLHDRTPFELSFDTIPYFDSLRVFGCLCFAHNQKVKGNKCAPMRCKCIFIGYTNSKKGWKLNDLETYAFL